MKRLAFLSPALVLLLLAAFACGEVPTPPLPGEVTPAPATPAPPTGVPATQPPATPDWPAEAQPLVDLAVADLAALLQVPPAEVAVVLVEAVVWPDGCLGCPAPGQACTEALVPGYRVVLRAAGREYEYRTDEVRHVLLCRPIGDGGFGDWGAAQRLVEAVVADLAGRTGIDPAQVVVVRVLEQQWSDSSIGCPQPGMAYLTVITPGYQIILQVAGRQYDYHTDLQSRFVLCEK